MKITLNSIPITLVFDLLFLRYFGKFEKRNFNLKLTYLQKINNDAFEIGTILCFI